VTFPSASDVPRILQSLGVKLDVDRLDQHLIVDPEVVRVVVDAARLEASDVVFEIGPGPGTITHELARQARRVVAIEVDRRFRPLLDLLPANVEVRYADAARARWPRFDALACNPPYGLLDPIVRRLFTLRPSRAVFLIGSATSRALVAPPGTRQFTRLSLIVQAAFDVDVVADVPAGAFVPRPRTTSRIVRLVPQAGRTRLWELADAVVRAPSARVNDVLWRAGRGDLRDVLRAHNMLQRRLQVLSNDELSAIAAALIAGPT
jgi:16S rRNA (adenine1518-N6/adenine1519-N6)-dimethyltransferase